MMTTKLCRKYAQGFGQVQAFKNIDKDACYIPLCLQYQKLKRQFVCHLSIGSIYQQNDQLNDP